MASFIVRALILKLYVGAHMVATDLSYIISGHSWLEIEPRERQRPFHFLNTSDYKQILNSWTLDVVFCHNHVTFMDM